MTKIDDLFENEYDLHMDNYIWVLSILLLTLFNNTDEKKPIINIFLGDD